MGEHLQGIIKNRISGFPKKKTYRFFRMLSALSGKTHEVCTGVCMRFLKESGEWVELVDSASTKVHFASLTKEEILAYIATGSPMDKAGAYGIQDGGLVDKIEGSFSNVVGLPVELCKEMLTQFSKLTN